MEHWPNGGGDTCLGPSRRSRQGAAVLVMKDLESDFSKMFGAKQQRRFKDPPPSGAEGLRSEPKDHQDDGRTWQKLSWTLWENKGRMK